MMPLTCSMLLCNSSTAEAPAAAAARSRVRAMTAECEVLTAQLAKVR